MPSKKPRVKNLDGVLEEEFERDPGFRAEWQRLTLAREVAAQLIGYRADQDLSQRDLAKLLGVSQPRIVELESGEKNPTIETLIRISRVTAIEFAIDVAPADRPPKLVVKRVRDSQPANVHDDVSVRVAAG